MKTDLLNWNEKEHTLLVGSALPLPGEQAPAKTAAPASAVRTKETTKPKWEKKAGVEK
jgi:hypothetical protein